MSAPRQNSTSRWLAGLTLACSTALLAPLTRPLFTGRVFAYNDLVWFTLPMRYLYQEALRAGDTVLWTPSVFAGFYAHGEGQSGLFHPFHQLLYRLLPLGVAFNVELIASYVVAFAGMAWLLRRLQCSPTAALVGAMLFAFSGFNLLHYHHVNMVAVVAHMPWLLAAADGIIVEERRDARRLAFAAMAAILGSQLLLGFPQAVWWSMLALAAFALWRAADLHRWWRLPVCGGAVALGILLGGIQLLPTADAAAHSMRTAATREFALSFSLHPWNLVQLWSPYFFAGDAYSADGDFMWFHEFGIYSGAILPVALAWVWMRRGAVPERRRLIAAITVGATVALALALGRYGGLAALLTELPVIGSLRVPARYVLLAQFGLAMVAALMVDDLLAIADGRRPRPARGAFALWIPAALAIATTAALNAGLLPYGRDIAATVRAAAPGVAVMVLVTALIAVAARGRRWAVAALVVVTAADLASYGIGFVYRHPPKRIRELIAAVPLAPDTPADTYAAAPQHGPYRSNVLVMRGYRLANGYVGLFPAMRHPLDTDASLRLAGTRWIFTPEGDRQPMTGSVDRIRVVDEHEQPATGDAILTIDRPGRLFVRVEAPGPRVVALTERFHDGWSAKAAGRPLPTVRVDGDFLGVVVGAGVHRIDLRFRPRSFFWGSIVSALGVALLAGTWALWPK